MLTPLPPGVQGCAAFGLDAELVRVARYRLDRWWGDDIEIDDDCMPVRNYRPLVVIGTNPSEAGADKDDNTVRKLYLFARRERANGICVVNTHPAITKTPAMVARLLLPDGVDDKHWSHVEEALAELAVAFVAAWGKPPPGLTSHRDRVDRVKKIASWNGALLVCFGTNGDGSPKHPLYLAGDTPLVPWVPR